MKKYLTGFTLLELIIVMVFLGILGAIAIPMYNNAVEKEKGNACINNIRMIIAAERIYSMNNNGHYTHEYSGPSYGNAPLATLNPKLNTTIDENNFGVYTSGAWRSDYFHIGYDTTSKILRVGARRISGPFQGRYIWRIGNPSGTMTWSGTWFNNFPLPED